MQTAKQTVQSELKLRWDALKLENPKLRTLDAAQKLGVSEAELLASTCNGENVRRLQGPWDEVIKELETLGYVMALTRNESVVHEKKGTYQKISFNGHVGLVLDKQIDLRIFLSHWKFGFAATVENPRGTLYSLQFFDGSGTAIHKVYLMNNDRLDAYNRLVEKFQHPDQTPQIKTDLVTAEEEDKPDSEIDVDGFLNEWEALKDTHDFFPLQRKYKVGRLQALRLAESTFTQQVSNDSTRRMLEIAAERQVPIMVFVSSSGVIQIHSGPVENIKVMDNWLNVLDKEFNLHLREDHIHQTWVVEKPTEDGVITSIEIFDTESKPIATFFGARKPGIPELEEWREITRELSELSEAQ